MKNSKVLLIVIFTLAYLDVLFAQDKSEPALPSGDLYVVITGYPTTQGTIKIALFGSERSYQSNISPLRGDSIQVEPNRSLVPFEDISYGDYAVKVYHDRNNDGKLNTNFMGMPTEFYGFSNNVRGMFGPASWSAAKFKFEAVSDSIHIVLK
jgi:uncharacterized protein (DUF2141 family)